MTRVRYCTNCGATISAGTTFCTECGQRVADAAEKPPPAPERVASTQPTPTAPPERRRRTAPDWPVVPLRTRIAAAAFNLGLNSCFAIAALAPTALLQRGALVDLPLAELIGLSLGAVAVTQVAAVLATTGRTPGIGRRLVRTGIGTFRGGQPAGVARSGLRALLLVVLAAPAGLALWSHLWHPTRRGWHERLSGTVTTNDVPPLRASVIPNVVAAIVATGCGIAVWLTTARL